jgi:hypothetical protein
MDIPGPDIVGLTAHFRCPLGCGWAHTEPTDPGPLRLAFTPGDLEGAINLDAQARGLYLQERVRAALRGHMTEEHPGAAADWE